MRRLRERHDDAFLAQLYATPHDHTRWADHIERVRATIEFANELCLPVGRVADLSCGDGTIARALSDDPILGDFAPGYEIHGPIEETIWTIDPVDLFICCETIEHLDTPFAVLTLIRTKAQRLLLSCPLIAPDQTDDNVEHYWAFSAEEMHQLLTECGWAPQWSRLIPGPYYTYQVWGAT
jgi:hypothetical protein